MDQSDPSCIAKLEAMLRQFTRDEEQAEIQLSLGVIYGQRTGSVNPAKAVPHFTEALRYELPPTVWTGVFVWRGKAQEQQERSRAALMDYIRGLLMCTQFDLSHGWPTDPPRLPEDTREETAVDPGASREAERRSGPASDEYLLQSRLLRIEREMLMHRYYLVAGVRCSRKPKWRKFDPNAVIISAVEFDEELIPLTWITSQPCAQSRSRWWRARPTRRSRRREREGTGQHASRHTLVRRGPLGEGVAARL